MHYENHIAMKMLAAQKMLLLLCVGVSLAHDSITQLKSIEERLTATEETLKELKRENEAKKVAFSAGLLASGLQQTGPFDTRTTLIYKKIFINTENAYDSNTGIFTAPVKGVYFFRFYAHAHSTKQMAVSLYKNDQIQCSVFTEKPETNTNGSNGVVLSLEKGDRVSTLLWENSWVYDDDNSYTSFSGFLLFPL
ncbi:Complement C1q tumor necrosis factor-related protein 6 [Anabarilius grahami]|uniref:Complement C1q tumor necrosis factor-related protein 6 n=1 Tax=Anabarilius grahami TaxID=495550 RepID=A0A3N0ZB31_ANAGA|nr:Complement C1q tumor necrosis factor-related protein 6 [Anabarilius grahami]